MELFADADTSKMQSLHESGVKGNGIQGDEEGGSEREEDPEGANDQSNDPDKERQKKRYNKLL